MYKSKRIKNESQERDKVSRYVLYTVNQEYWGIRRHRTLSKSLNGTKAIGTGNLLVTGRQNILGRVTPK